MSHSFATSLSSAQRSGLKALAHSLKPIIQVGNGGLGDSVVAEIKRALESHELLKIQLPGNNTAEEKKDALAQLTSLLPKHAHVVHRIGRAVIVYLEKDPKDAKIALKSFVRSRKLASV
jgi:RNA-binding protein